MKTNLTGMARIGDGMMRTGPLLHLPAVLTSFRVDPGSVFLSAGVKKSDFDQPEGTIPVRKAVRLMVAGAERTGRAHFGLLVGQRLALKQFGLMGLRMMHAPSVGAAWRGLVLTLHLNDRINVPALIVRDRVATLSFTPYAVQSEGIYHVMDYTLAAACVAMRTLCGPAWTPAEVHLAHRPPVDPRPYQSFFQSPVTFGAATTALIFPAQWLDRKIAGADPAVRGQIEQIIAGTLREQELDLVTKVRRALFAQLTQDDVSIDGVAEIIGLHKRTLNRRLADKSTSFARLLGEVRFHLARELLLETDLPLIDIAATLNYTDASAFSRAFRSWARTSPSVWREAHAAPRQRPRSGKLRRPT